MAYTKPSDIVDIQVVGQLANEVLYDKTSLLTTGYIQNANDVAIVGGTGKTVDFLKIDANDSDFATNNKNESAATAGHFTMDTDTEQVEPLLCSVRIEDSVAAYLARIADPNTYMAMHVAKKAQKKVQSSLLTKAAASSLTYTSLAGQATWDEIVKAKTDNWGEYAWDDDPALLVAHSNVVHDIVCSTEAKQSGVFGGVSTVESGRMIRGFAGCNVLPLDSIGATDGLYSNIILRKDALSLWTNINMKYGEQRLPGTTVWVMDWWFEFASHLSANVPIGAIVFKATSTRD